MSSSRRASMKSGGNRSAADPAKPQRKKGRPRKNPESSMIVSDSEDITDEDEEYNVNGDEEVEESSDYGNDDVDENNSKQEKKTDAEETVKVKKEFNNSNEQPQIPLPSSNESSPLSPLYQEEEDKALLELQTLLSDFVPLIPDAVTDYYMNTCGITAEDPKVKKLIALSAQKFITDVSTEALQFAKIRSSDKGANSKIALTTDDLTCALAEYGIDTKKPFYYV